MSEQDGLGTRPKHPTTRGTLQAIAAGGVTPPTTQAGAGAIVPMLFLGEAIKEIS